MSRQERLAAKNQRRIEKEIGLYKSAMNRFLALQNPRFIGKSGVVFPLVKGNQVALPSHHEDGHLSFYFGFFADIVERFNIYLDADVCSLIFEEGDS